MNAKVKVVADATGAIVNVSANNPEYGFRNSDLKQDYMKKQQMKSKMVSPSIPTNIF